MPLLTHFNTPVSEPINSQILQLVVDHLSDISAMEIAPSNLLYSIYQYAIGFEVHLYLQALDGSKGIDVELLVATDDQDPEKVTGFALYLPVKDDPQACGIAYMAELASHRQQGVTRAMVAQVVRRYPHTELTCSVSKVAAFEAMGLQVIGTRGPQVLMNTRDHSSDVHRSAPDPYLPAATQRQEGHARRREKARPPDRSIDRQGQSLRGTGKRLTGQNNASWAHSV